jgi:hypothetical protein
MQKLIEACRHRIAALEVPLLIKLKVLGNGGASAYLGEAARAESSGRRASPRKLDGMLTVEGRVLHDILEGVLPVRAALEAGALDFAGDLSVLSLLEQAFGGALRDLASVPSSRTLR